VALALVAAGVAVAAVYALSDLVRAIRGQEIKTKGFIEQTADLLGQGKGVLVEMRQWIPILLGLAALGGGIYFLSKRRGRGSEAVSASSSVSLPALTGV
jgi:LPXTG-motif cell wall-anchored protein